MKCSVNECDTRGPIGSVIILRATGRTVPGSNGIREYKALCRECEITEKAATKHEQP